MVDITRRCGNVLANDSVSLTVQAGSVHAIVGENGAGKSTLMKILDGFYEADRGTVRIFGKQVRFRSPADAIAAGIGMVHQHFMLVPPFTVAENVVLGGEGEVTGPAGFIRTSQAEAHVAELVDRYRLNLRADARVETLGVGQQQRVEILKVLYRNARIIILDEPTAVLTPQEVDELFATVRSLRDAGATILIITHKLQEVMALSDRLTILRAGRKVADLNTTETTPEEIARLMVGRDIILPALAAELRQASEPPARPNTAPDGQTSSPAPTCGGAGAAILALRLEDVTVQGHHGRALIERVSLEVAPGEILGIAGVEGNGQTELVGAITGLTPVSAGRILIGGRDVTRYSPRRKFAAGLACIPEDRHREGLILSFTLAENLMLGRHHRRRHRRQVTGDRARELLERFDVRPLRPSAQAHQLSGGNQQKVIIARETTRNAPVLLAAQPTRGVDLGAIEFIHRTLLELRASGTAILLVSAELTEILALSDRVAVMYAGRLVFTGPNQGLTEHDLGIWMTGGSAHTLGASHANTAGNLTE